MMQATGPQAPWARPLPAACGSTSPFDATPARRRAHGGSCWAQESGDLISPGYVRYAASQPDIVGREALKEVLRAYQEAFADNVMRVEDQIAEGDKVVTRWSGAGRQVGEFAGVAASFREVRLNGIVIQRIADGKIAEEWENFDALGVLVQLGVLPEFQLEQAD
jgi:predicted ester cyclase